MMTSVQHQRNYYRIGLIAIIISILAIYFIFFFPNLKLVIYNKTNYDIDSLRICNKYFNIKKSDSLIINKCKSISMQGGLPFGLPEAKIQGKLADTFPLLLCGTGVENVKRGLYQFDITILEDSSFFRLYWQPHK